jgi:alkylation response protein AidB-like acyl-CoA dehydrogenase
MVTLLEIISTMDQWKSENRPPEDLMRKMGEAGLLAALCGPPYPSAYLPPEVAAQAPKDFDYFHELILIDELSRCGHAGVIAGITNGPAIALTVMLRFGSEEMKRKVVPDVLLGRKFIGLAVSEPQAGSDVAGLTATATREGDVYIANGNKKWITNGTYAHYFSTALRTGPSRGQLSFFLVEADMPGFSARKVNVRDSNISGTAYLDFDQCRIPKANLIGPENDGFKLVMYNFNHERFYVSVIANRLSRVCIEECVKYALRRNVFEHKLADVQTIRMKISAMARAVEAQQAWLESLVYQMCTMSHAEANEKLGDVISLLKVQASKVYELCARETTMIFGGNALYMDGVGRKIEPAVAQVKGYQIPAGAEDVMDDYAGRTAFKRALAIAKL